MPSPVPDALSDQITRRSVLRGAGAAVLATVVPLGVRARQGTPVAGPAVADAIDQFAGEALAEYGVPGAAIAVVHRGEPLLVKGYGVREAGSDERVDGDTVFQLASNTKPMTSFTLATLVDENRVDWTTLVSEVLPELRLMDAYATLHATPRDFLSHRGGFPAFFGDLLGRLGYDRAETLRRLRYVEPGDSFRDVAAYSNLGYFIVGEMIARLTDAPWEDAMRARLFEPLSMTRSGPSLAELPMDGNVSANHAVVDGTLVTVEADRHGVIGAAGSAFSTANDLVHWMQMLVAGGSAGGEQIVDTKTMRTMFDPVIASEVSFTETPPIGATSGFSYSLGWGNFHWHGHEVLEKGGALAGIRTVVNLVPELELGVAVLANLNITYLPEAIRAFVLELFLGASEVDMQPEIRQLGTQLDEAFAATPEPPANALGAEVPLENLAGMYEQDLHGRFVITVEGEGLRLEAGPAAVPASLKRFGLNTFLLDWGEVTSLPEPIRFVLGSEGRAIAFETESLGRFDLASDA